MSTKPDTPVEDRGPPNLRQNSKNYLHRLECSAISIEVYVCQRDIISSKPDTLDRDCGPSNLRRSSKNCLPRFNFDAISTSGYNTLKSRSRQSITRRKNLISETLVKDFHIHVRIATQKCKVDCPLLEYSGYVLEYSRRVGVLYNEFYIAHGFIKN